MSEPLKPYILAVAVMLEFQRLGKFEVPMDLLHQCLYEGYVLAQEHPEWKEDLPQLQCKHSGREYAPNWRYSVEVESDLNSELFERVQVDCRHLGIGYVLGVRLPASTRLKVQDGYYEQIFRLNHPALAVVASTVGKYLAEEANLRSSFERALRTAEGEIVEQYKELGKARYLRQ